MRKHKVTYEPTYNGHPINTNKEKKQGCATEILDKYEAIADDAIANRCKVMDYHFALRYPAGSDCPADNRDIKRFTENYRKHLKREGLDPHCLWVREQSKAQLVEPASVPPCSQPEERTEEQPAAQRHHYHCVYLLDGNKTASPHNHLKKAEELWVKAVGAPEGTKGLVDYCDKARDGSPQRNAIMLRRISDKVVENYDEAFYHASYLAKIRTKGHAPKGVRQYGGTEVPKAKGSKGGGGHGHG